MGSFFSLHFSVPFYSRAVHLGFRGAGIPYPSLLLFGINACPWETWQPARINRLMVDLLLGLERTLGYMGISIRISRPFVSNATRSVDHGNVVMCYTYRGPPLSTQEAAEGRCRRFLPKASRPCSP